MENQYETRSKITCHRYKRNPYIAKDMKLPVVLLCKERKICKMSSI